MAHIRFVGLDVELLTRVLLDRRADLTVELDLVLQRVGLIGGVASLGEILRNGGVGADKDGNGLVERNPKRLGLTERVQVGGRAAEVMQELFDLARYRHRPTS